MRLVLIPVMLLVAALTGWSAAHAEAGADYFLDAGGAIDWLARGQLDEFFANQPFMGPFSLLVRAPFVKAVFHADEPTVYLVGVLPCFAALAALVLLLVRRMERAGRSSAEQIVVALVVLASPITVRAVHWGHPEELLAAALAVGGVLLAARGRPLWAGLLIGLAFATKQWALVAGVPALLALPRDQVRFVATAVATSLLLYGPMYLGDPERFTDIMQAASSTWPEKVLGVSDNVDMPGPRVTPTNVWWPFAGTVDAPGGVAYWQPEWLGRLTHPAIVLAAPLLGALIWWRRRSSLPGRDAMALLALLFALRGLLDPMNLDYYHLALLTALGALAALGGRREAMIALAVAAGLGLAFVQPAVGMYDVFEHALPESVMYLATMLPLAFWLGRDLLSPAARTTAAEAPAVAGAPHLGTGRT